MHLCHTLGVTPLEHPRRRLRATGIVSVVSGPDSPRPNEGYRLSEVVRRAHRRGPTSRWAGFYRRHWNTWRRHRRAQWDRPPEPRDWRWVIGLFGRALIVIGLLMLGFVGYQLWGTGLETARAQRDLADKFEQQLSVETTTAAVVTTTAAQTTTSIADDTAAPTSTDLTTTSTLPPAPVLDISLGDPVARLEIPTIGTDHYVVAGVGVDELQLGPGHFPDTPLPGQLGNAAIAGHRTTYGQPFHDVDRLEPGDEIIVTTAAGRFVYRVRETLIVEPSDYHVVATSDPTIAELTLTSCHPKWSAAQRIIIHANLDPTQSDTPTARSSYLASSLSSIATTTTLLPDETATTVAAAETTPTTASPTTSSTSTSVPIVVEDTGGTSTATTDAFAAGWFHDPAALTQGILWTIPMIVLILAVRWWSHRRRSWFPALPVALIPGIVVLYFIYENVNGLLPPNL
jgi:sortase A